MECIKRTVCKEVDELDNNLRPNVCMVLSPLAFIPRTICHVILLAKNYKEIGCKESIISLDSKHSFPNYRKFVPEAFEYHRENKGLNLIRKQNTICYNL